MRQPWLALLLAGTLLCGCATVPLGPVVDDPAIQSRLIEQIPVPDANQVVYHTILYWPGRELSLIEIVKARPEGGLSLAGLTELGNTLYTAQADELGEINVLQNNLPLSDTWLSTGLIAELIIPWQGPLPNAQLRQGENDTWQLYQNEPGGSVLFIFDQDDAWNQTQLLSGRRIRSQTLLQWDQHTVPSSLHTHNKRYHYRAIRECASVK